MGLNLLLATLVQQFRIVERFRLYMTKTWESKEAAPWRLPRNLSINDDSTKAAKQKDDMLVQSKFGSVRVLVSSGAMATSTLQMTLITIRPGCEMMATRAAALEVYQVLAGVGRVSQQGIVASADVDTGQVWVVDPGSMRWISNRDRNNGTTDLVLLRTVDSALPPYTSSTHLLNRIVMDPTHQSLSLYEKFSASVKQSMGRIVSNMSFSKITSST